MRRIDEELRRDEEKEKIWMEAFHKARRGWGRVGAVRLELAIGNPPDDNFVRETLSEADALLTEALQILASADLHKGELAEMIRKSLIEIGELSRYLKQEPARA